MELEFNKNRTWSLSGWFFIFVLIIGGSCRKPAETGVEREQVNKTLNDWHQAAAKADFQRYFSYFASDSAIFIGTDATERWTISEFKPWAKPYFDRGTAWNFTPAGRHIYFSENGKMAWFDEMLETPNLGPSRGTGVLVKKRNKWKIAHYSLSIPIPNAIADSVVKQVRRELSQPPPADSGN